MGSAKDLSGYKFVYIECVLKIITLNWTISIKSILMILSSIMV